MKATLYSASWCGPCQALKALLAKPENADIAAAIERLDVDTKKGNAGANKHGVLSVPALVREDGVKLEGVRTPKALRKWLGL